ncbi:photosynthetic reaction center subunit H [Telmatospirillum siberiense]|uniref:Photosynthetic reaction center subunit H n=1 Tax=Telmatospirillum siberiense TaxID=382514 RepID=A0A2N3PTB2_9PROT|nr:photosynthetic reaction center subunit H [Telmatospirillum siberiense]PKU23645.1 photosynthetic reaction center subunit H [Telmatospirillum siberiense]
MDYTHSGIDFSLVSIYVFWALFSILIIYLRREDRREGYPLEEDGSGQLRPAGGLLFTAPPKTFRLPLGGGELTVPNDNRDNRDVAAQRTSITPGSPLQPTGNPMIDGVGPAAFAERAKVPDLTFEGLPKIVPISVAANFAIADGDPDIRGWSVLGTDGRKAGVVKDIWVDRAESMVRYIEVTLADGEASVLLPITVALIDKRRHLVDVEAITAAQFADVPKIAKPDQITFYEEERIVAYYGGGFLYATPDRVEPLL